jgi:hypothetical protein
VRAWATTSGSAMRASASASANGGADGKVDESARGSMCARMQSIAFVEGGIIWAGGRCLIEVFNVKWAVSPSMDY